LIDFHCHISTDSAITPAAEGKYYQTLPPIIPPGDWLDWVWQETIETISETWRNPLALRQYEQLAPVIYSEMTRRMQSSSVQRLTMEMARNHVRQAVVVAIDPYVPTSEVVEACLATKGILLPFASVDPLDSNWRSKLEENLALPICGFKLHDQLQQMPYAAPRISEILTVVQNMRPNLPVYLHTGQFPIYKPIGERWHIGLELLLNQFPGLRFICGHCGWNRPSLALRAAKRHSNLWLETSWQPPKVIRKLCDLLGPERLILGSDYPLYSMRRSIRNSKQLLTVAEFRQVSEDNARKILETSDI
jgi:predicted TIM-barrel fold metal-dependent hydrolase